MLVSSLSDMSIDVWSEVHELAWYVDQQDVDDGEAGEVGGFDSDGVYGEHDDGDDRLSTITMVLMSVTIIMSLELLL